MPLEYADYWKLLDCAFPRVATVFPDCLQAAQAVLGTPALEAYITNARFLGKMGRGAEPILIFLEVWPEVARSMDADAQAPVMDCIRRMWKSPNGNSITPFLQALPSVARRLHSVQQLQSLLEIALDLMQRTTGSIHGIHQTFPSPGLPEFFAQLPSLLGHLSLAGLKNWVDYGVRYYNDHPDRQQEYFSLQSADSRAVLQRERHGSLLVEYERRLAMYLRGLWNIEAQLVAIPDVFDEVRLQISYDDAHGMRLPEVYEALQGISGLDRYRAALSHMAAHRSWSRPMFADNYSPFQRMAIECLEDCRVEYLAMQRYPGLRRIYAALHPVPLEDACDPQLESGLRHRLAMLSRAILDAQHPYRNPQIIEFAKYFHQKMPNASSVEMAELAVTFIVRTHQASDNLARVHFKDSAVSYRDDNRQLWRFIEQGDEEDAFDQPENSLTAEEGTRLPPRHYHEWDYLNQCFRPDWVSVYESLHPSGNSTDIEQLLEKHAALAKRLKKILDLLKPQEKIRIRYQEEGSELDLDIALRSLIDFKSGAMPDPRINMSHQRNGRNIAVLLLLDLSQSLNEKAAGVEQTILELSREAVALLGWAIDKLGDPFAIAGFHSNTRHEVRYQHIKGFTESWDDQVKGRLAAMDAAYSTRMGAALRHAAHYLQKQQAEKKLLLILTDGEPSDVDCQDGLLLIEDARQAVKELEQQAIYAYCINLDAGADAYVSNIFGKHYTIIDKVAQLPEKLPELFISLTR